MSGHSIVPIRNFYIGNFVEDYKEGEGTQYFSAWYEDVEDYPQGKTAWTLTVLELRVSGQMIMF